MSCVIKVYFCTVVILEVLFIKKPKFSCDCVLEFFSSEVIAKYASTTIDPLLIKVVSSLELYILPPREHITNNTIELCPYISFTLVFFIFHDINSSHLISKLILNLIFDYKFIFNCFII